MKKFIITSAATFLMATCVNAKDNQLLAKNDVPFGDQPTSASKLSRKETRQALRILKGSEVSFFSKQQFYQDFGNVPVSNWERNANFDEATFKQNGKTYTAFYDDNSQLVGTTSEKAFTDLPMKAQEYINKKYDGYKVTDVLFYNDNELNETDMVLYNIQFDDIDSYFVELKKDNKSIVLQVSPKGDVDFFTTINY